MEEVELLCFRKNPKRVRIKKYQALFRDVYRLNDIVIKVRKADDVRKAMSYAYAENITQKEIRKKFSGKMNFPKYYRSIVSALRIEDSYYPAALSFYEYIPSLSSLKEKIAASLIYGIIFFVKSGHVIDAKPENFGKKGRRYYYIDSGGISERKFWLPLDWSEALYDAISGALSKIRRMK
jgi:hypothetical protein